MTIVNRGTINQESVLCSTACETCKDGDPNFCLSCDMRLQFFDPILGTCTVVPNPAPSFFGIHGCRTALVKPDNSLECHRCGLGGVLDYRSGRCNQDSIFTILGQSCWEYSHSMFSKDIYAGCIKCVSNLSVVFEGRCQKIDTPNCSINWAQSRTPACRRCNSGYFTSESGVCVTTCDTLNGMGVMDEMYAPGAKFCARCPENCKTCEFDPIILDFKCTSCFNPASYIIFKDLCVSNDCTDNLMGPNK